MGSTVGWQDVVAAKRSIRDELTNIDKPIDVTTNCVIENAGEYHAALLSEKVTCLATTWSYIKQARETHRLTNCLTEVAFKDALQRAKELDQHLQETGGLIGPLHGIPVTLKDQFNLKGYDTTLGYVGRAFNPAAEDAALVRILKDLGAVVLAKSNLPQSIMWCETENPLWGLTTHLKDMNYTPGGSTGGEGVLLASQASCLGWGTDIGGSIRIPSHMQGLYGLKPTSYRLPYRGVPVSTDGQEHVPSSTGPMARSLDMIELAMRGVLGQKPWMMDPRCSPIPWREEIYQGILDQKSLTIGVLFDDGVVTPHPPITRVLKQAVERLGKAGHDVVPWNAELHAECIAVMDQFYTADGGQDIRDAVAAGGEPLIPHVDRLINSGKDAISVYEYWQLNKQKVDLQQRYLDKWNSTFSPATGLPVDILVMPPMPHVAVPHGGCRWVGYTKVWNFLDYTALVIPAGKVSSEDLQAEWDCEGRVQGSADEWNAKLWERSRDRMAELELPAGIQIVGRKCEEEKVLAAARVIDGLISGN